MKLHVLVSTAAATLMPKFFEMQNDHALAATLDLDLVTYRAFAAFEEAYAKNYAFDERQVRAKIFAQNYAKIERHNGNELNTWTMGVNEHVDLTFDEFRQQRLMVGQGKNRNSLVYRLFNKHLDCSATTTQRHEHSMVGIPDYTDWRQKGGVSPVKNQGHCGSCWTFSTTGCLESAHAIHHGNFFNLSEQQLVDCAQDYDNNGCNGGLPSHAFELRVLNFVQAIFHKFQITTQHVSTSCPLVGSRRSKTTLIVRSTANASLTSDWRKQPSKTRLTLPRATRIS